MPPCKRGGPLQWALGRPEQLSPAAFRRDTRRFDENAGFCRSIHPGLAVPNKLGISDLGSSFDDYTAQSTGRYFRIGKQNWKAVIVLFDWGQAWKIWMMCLTATCLSWTGFPAPTPLQGSSPGTCHNSETADLNSKKESMSRWLSLHDSDSHTSDIWVLRPCLDRA